MKYTRYYLIALCIVLIDQGVKLWVHHSMTMGAAGEIPVIGNFFKLHYITNPGMAFGIDLVGKNSKLFLSLIRLVIVIGIGYYLYYSLKRSCSLMLGVAIGIILGGALGNVIDSTFYGVWLDNAPATALSPWLHGQVIDMFYLDIWHGRIADHIPLIGGRYLFLWPIFNVADASIFMGIVLIFLSSHTLPRPSSVDQDHKDHKDHENHEDHAEHAEHKEGHDGEEK